MAINLKETLRAWILIGACGCLFSNVLCAQKAYCSQPQLDNLISGIGSRSGNIIEMLYQVGQGTGTCFGVDVRDQGFLKKHFDLAGQLSLRKFLASFGPAVTYSTGESFVYVRVGNGARDWLDVVMPSFQTAEAPPEIVDSELSSRLYALANPGSGSLGDTSFSESEKVRAFSMKNATVRAVITALVTNTSGGGMWFTARPHPAQDTLPSQPFWTILVYAEARDLNELRLRKALGVP